MQSVRRSVGCGGLMGLLFILLAACQPGAIPTAISTPSPTALPMATTTPIPVATSTLIPAQRILFSGGQCMSEEQCAGDYMGPWQTDLYMVNSDGTNLRALVEGNELRLLSLSPNGKRLLVRDYRKDSNGDGELNYLDQPQLFTLDLTTLNMQLLASGFSWAEWLPDSEHLVYGGGGNLYTARYDGAERVSLVEMALPLRSWFQFALSPDASLIAYLVCAFGEDQCTLYCVNTDGTAQYIVATFPNNAGSAYVKWSPRGDRIAVSVPFPGLRKQADIFSVKTDGSETRQVFRSDNGLIGLWWLSDGERLGFATDTGDNTPTCFKIDLNGDNLEEMGFLDNLGTCISGEWSPDRRLFATTLAGDWSSGQSIIERLGLYVLSLDDENWQQILSGYSIDGLAWLSDSVTIP